ncbi:hypothetical protein ABZ468_35330 [Streptomyces sp. NPDC005708]|uniref:hypothetical protein n=1 Tax=Streptomyces sp. NPDC005708 TaxID=3154564 RepID=UPI0033D396D4
MDTLVSPLALVLTTAALFSLGAMTLFLVHRRRHGKPSTPHGLHPGERKGLAVLSDISTFLFLATAAMFGGRHDASGALGGACLTLVYGIAALGYAIRPLAIQPDAKGRPDDGSAPAHNPDSPDTTA